MKIRINTKVISALSPCLNRLDNWLTHYADFDGDVQKFLKLDEITPQDKIWICLRLFPRTVVETFAIDCVFTAAAATGASTAASMYEALYVTTDPYLYDYANSATAAASYAAISIVTTTAAYVSTAAYAVAVAAERQNQVKVLAYLIKVEEEI